MKKILLIIAVLTCFITSCSNEDIEITYSGGLTVNVSTQNAYDDFDLTQEYKQSLLSQGYNVGVYSYLYGADGKLVASDSVYSRTFDMVSTKFDRIPKGSYTLITLEMIVNPDDKYRSNYWTIVGQENLETIEIKTRYTTVYSDGVVGLASREVSVDGGDGQTVSIQPRGIGSVVDIMYMNFNESPFNRVAFYTKDAPVGRYLSPRYTGSDRFEDDEYNPNRTWATRGYIYKAEGLNREMESDIYLIEEGTVRYCYGPSTLQSESDQVRFTAYPTNGADFRVVDGSTYYGGLWYTGGNPNCEYGLFDTKTDLFEWMLNMERASSTILAPYLAWGASASSVDTYMRGGGASLSNSGTNVEEGMYWSYYENADGTIGYEYQFDSDKTNLGAVFMTFFAKTLDQVKEYIGQSYEGGDYEAALGGYLFYSDDTALLVSESEDKSYVQVLFVPNVEGSSTRGTDFVNVKNSLKVKRNNK